MGCGVLKKDKVCDKLRDNQSHMEEAAATHWESAGPLTLDMIDLEDNKESL